MSESMGNNEMTTKKCKYCQSDIPQKAKVCPYCRRKQKGALKWIIILAVVLLLFMPMCNSEENESASGTVSSQTQTAETITQKEESVGDTVKQSDAETEEIADLSTLVDITTYSYENTIGDTLFFMAFKNNSSVDIKVNFNVTGLDAEGTKIGADSSYVNVIGAGEEGIGYAYFDQVSGIKNFEYTVDYSDEPYMKPAVSLVKVEEIVNEKNVVITCENTSEDKAVSIEAYAIFLKDGQVVGYDSRYFSDADYELKPGKTISEQLETYKAFDDVKCYYVGYQK